MKNKLIILALSLLTINSCQKNKNKPNSVKSNIDKVYQVNDPDSIKTNVKKTINRVYGSVPIPELIDFVREIEKSDWNPDTLRLKKIDYYSYLKEKTLFNEYPFYKIKYENTEIKRTNEYEPELLKEQSNNSKNQVDIELFKNVKSIWGYFYRGKKIGNSISDGVIEQWEFNNEEDAEKALNQIRPAGHLVYFNTMPYHYRIKNYLITFRTRAMAYSYEQRKVFEQFIKTAPKNGYK